MKKYLLKNLVFFILTIPSVYLICICLIKTNYSGTLPGGLVSVDREISIIHGEENTGSFNSIFVLSIDELTIFQRFLVSDNKTVTVDENNEIFSHLTNNDLIKIGSIQKNQAYESALINAYSYANSFNPSVIIDYQLQGFIIEYTSIYEEIFKPGDIITSIDGISISTPQDFKAHVNSLEAFHDASITYKRNNTEYSVVYQSPVKRSFTFYYKYSINTLNTAPSYSIHPTATSGPSAGLMQTLSLVDQLLTDDLASGLKIAGTGTMNDDGSVGAIGGIKQKVLSAHKAGSDVFLVPEANYEEVKDYYKSLNSKMKLFSVGDLVEAIYVLKNLL